MLSVRTVPIRTVPAYLVLGFLRAVHIFTHSWIIYLNTFNWQGNKWIPPHILALWVAVIPECVCASTHTLTTSCCYSGVSLLLHSYSSLELLVSVQYFHFDFLLFLIVFAPPLIFSLRVSVIPECICFSSHTFTLSCYYSWVYLLLLSYSHFELLLFLSVFAPPLILSLWVSVTPECVCSSSHILFLWVAVIP